MGKPSVMESIGSQKVGRDSVTEQLKLSLFITELYLTTFNPNIIISISIWMELLNKFGIEESNCNSTQSVKLKKLLNVKIKTNKQKKT